MWKLNNAFPKTKPVGQSKDQKGGKPESNGNRNNIPKLMELIYYVHSFSMHVLSNLKCSCTEINWTCLFSCSVQFSHSVMSDSLQPMDCSMPGLPVHHQLPELTQLISIESVMPSNHLILCRLLLLPPSIFPRGFNLSQFFSNESLKKIVLDNLGGSSSKYLKTLRAKNRISREEILLQNCSLKSCLSLQPSSMF